MPNNLLNVFFFSYGFFSSGGWGGGVGGFTLGGGLLFKGFAAGFGPKKLAKSLGGGLTGFWFPPIGSWAGWGFGSTFT
jgi:hypothetical protein